MHLRHLKCMPFALFRGAMREIAKHLSLPPVKLHCSMLAEDAIKAAVKDYEAKKAKMVQQNAEPVPVEKAADA
ncbi:putative NIF system FeS cluster assembly [Cocos nucifera]|uniref:Putative NIF system FeS cluster assembly n=1 Tax=Cocos nucifera TaxID=13894 RepID=A0A8K0IVE9_COCNU|nr:putative NIF system FeS cluster assembly [Cocos nucifera]